MKKLMLLLIVIVCGCSQPEKGNSIETVVDETELLARINAINKLRLIYMGDECGEWGGDKQDILIYRMGYRGPLFANLFRVKMNCETNSRDTIESKYKIELSNIDKVKVIGVLQQLSLGIINRENYPGHSGYLCQAFLSDSSIVLSDFPAIKWTELEEFSESLIKR